MTKLFSSVEFWSSLSFRRVGISIGCGILVELMVGSSVSPAVGALAKRWCRPLDVGGLGTSGLKPRCAGACFTSAELFDVTLIGIGFDLVAGRDDRTSAVCCWCCAGALVATVIKLSDGGGGGDVVGDVPSFSGIVPRSIPGGPPRLQIPASVVTVPWQPKATNASQASKNSLKPARLRGFRLNKSRNRLMHSLLTFTPFGNRTAFL